MRQRALAAIAAGVAGPLFGVTGPALAHEIADGAGSAAAPGTTAACGSSDTLYLDAANGDSAETCRYRSGLGP